MPVSYFKDVLRSTKNTTAGASTETEIFPRRNVAITSPVPLNENAGKEPQKFSDPGKCALPISGTEDPRNMFFMHRADFVPQNGGYVHYNKLDTVTSESGFETEWNQMQVRFLPARYVGGVKCSNAYLQTVVNNDNTVFIGELKSGTRSANRRQAEQGGRDENGDPVIVFEDDIDPEKAVYVNGTGDMALRILGHWGTPVRFKNPKILSTD